MVRWISFRHVLLAAALLAWAGPAMADVHQVKTLRIWQTETEPATVGVLSDIARRFEAAHRGVVVEIEGLAFSDLESRIAASLAAGSPPELAHGQPITCAALQVKGLLMPLDDVVRAIGEDNIPGEALRICQAGGRQYGLPHAMATSLLLYRRDMADRLGVVPPRSWADLLAAARALTQDTDKDGITDIYGVGVPADSLFLSIVLGELIRANGGALFSDDNRPLLTDRRMIETLEFLRTLLRYAPPGWERRDYRQSYESYVAGKTAILLSGHGRGAGLIERSVPEAVANEKTFGVWTKPPGPSGSAPAAQMDAEPWMVFKTAQNPELALTFLRFFYRDDNYLAYVSTVPIHLLPITRSLSRSPEYRKIPMLGRWNSWLEMQRDYLEKDQAKPTLVAEWSDLASKPYLLDVLQSDILRDMIIDVVIERMSAPDAAEKAQKRMEALLRRKGWPKP